MGSSLVIRASQLPTMRSLLILSLAGIVASKVIFPVPEPYRWDETFTVKHPQIDDEHRGLFNAILKVERENTEANIKEANVKYHDHFTLEQGLFKQTMSMAYIDDHLAKHGAFLGRFDKWTAPVPESELTWAKNWLVQHIKNIDFQYVGLLPHHVPKPYNWDDSVEVFYARIDDEHKVLFDHIRELGHTPESKMHLSNLKSKMRAHFDYERGLFCNAETYYDCEEHSLKHETFFKRLNAFENPVPAADTDWAKNWLVQHIINTDFDYKSKLNTYTHEVPRPYIWTPRFSVFYDRLDAEHVALFDAIRDVVDHPEDAEKYAHLVQLMAAHFVYEQGEFLKIPNFDAEKHAFCKTKLRMHFDYEEGEFCKVEGYDCYGHYLKHYNFQTKFQSAHLPIPKEITDEAKNWLAQHIKNTDFAYRGKLHLRRHYVVPEPYIWETSFSVGDKQPYTQMDDEHVGLFDIVRDVEADRNSQELWDKLQALYNEHFRTEEALFTTIRDNKHDIADHRLRHLGLMNTVKGAQIPITEEMTDFIKNWLAQHIKNTDFTYKGLLPEIHPIPAPFKWNSFFAVFYQDMDEDHKVLFSCLADIEANPSDDGILASCLKSYQDHFKAETDLLAKSTTYPKEELYQHINKHNILLKSMAGLTTPVAQKWIDFAKNWLTQHIPNTDFRYKNMMPFPVADPYVWDESF